MPVADATKFAESFTRYELGNTTSSAALLTELTSYWTQIFSRVDIISNGRNGQGLRIQWGSYIFKTLPHASEWVVEFAFRINSGNGGGTLFQLLNNDDAAPICISPNFDGTITVYAGGVGGPILGTSDKVLHRNQWYHASLVVSLAESGGTIRTTADLKINGETWVPSATVNTGIPVSSLLSGDATVNVAYFEPGLSSAGNSDIDDLVIRSGTTTRFGDVEILGIVPNGDVVSDFTTSSGSAHFSLVNEIPVDNDTTYVKSGTIAQQDIWDWQDIPTFSGTLKSVVISMCARKDDEGSKAFKIVVGDTGTEDESEDFYVGDSYIYHHTAWDLDPNGDIPWTRTNFNSKRWGVKITV